MILNGLTLVKNVVYLMMHSLSAFMKMVASVHRGVCKLYTHKVNWLCSISIRLSIMQFLFSVIEQTARVQYV